MESHYSLIVIGSGPGGYVAAIKAASEGKKVALIEERDTGGTCLNRGCIPTKAYLHTAELYCGMQNSQMFGVNSSDISLDVDALRKRKDEVVSRLGSGIESLFKKNKIDYIKGRAYVIESGKVRVNTDVLTCDDIIVAVGSKPYIPPILGASLPGVVTSDEILALPSGIYKSLVIIGGGVIGVEISSFFNAFGCDVTIIEAMDRILPFADREISQNLSMILKKHGVKIITNAKVQTIDTDGELIVNYEQAGKTQIVLSESVLIAVGRAPNTSGVFAPELESKLMLEKGFIPVNKNFETNVAGIYAIGDCIKGGTPLAHVASAQGVNAVLAIAGKRPERDTSVVAYCIYTNPEIAYAGLTADAAKEMNKPVNVVKSLTSANGKSLINAQERGFVKLIFDADNSTLLGAHLMCERATDLISELSAAIVNKLTAEQLASVIRPHPTFAETITDAVDILFSKTL